MTTPRDRAHGALFGQLCGDSLGSLVEFEAPATIAAAYPGGVRELADGGTYGLSAGQPTDDSELALALARTIVQDGRFVAGNVREAYLAWLASPPFDCGTAVRAGLSGHPLPASEANGAAMRISPLGIACAGRSDDEVAALALEDAALTHVHPVSTWGSALLCVAVARAIAAPVSPAQLFAQVCALARRRAPPTLVAALERAVDGPPPDLVHQQGHVLLALRNAFAELLSGRSPEEALVATVGRGGDTDTNAAIAGALLGAVHGVDAWPARWIRTIEACRPGPGTPKPRPERFWPHDARALADDLLALSPAGRG